MSENGDGQTVTNRDSIRSQLFNSASKKRRSKKINMFGTEVEVRQPSVGQVLELQNSKDQKNTLVRMLIEYCYVPGTNEKVFEEGDQDQIMSWPVDDWFQQFNDAVTELASINVQEAEKN